MCESDDFLAKQVKCLFTTHISIEITDSQMGVRFRLDILIYFFFDSLIRDTPVKGRKKWLIVLNLSEIRLITYWAILTSARMVGEPTIIIIYWYLRYVLLMQVIIPRNHLQLYESISSLGTYALYRYRLHIINNTWLSSIILNHFWINIMR